MKRFPADIIAFLLIALFANAFLQESQAGTCTSITRTAFGANTVLTSAELNGQFDTVFNASNALDGGCISDATLQIEAVDSSWNPLLNQLQGGCKVSYSSASELSISKCALAVDGELVNTTIATSVAFGCGSCSSETSGAEFFVYVADGSTGTTLTPKILSTEPDADGYSGTDKAIARFYNNASGDIETYSIDQWHTNRFFPQETGKITDETITIEADTTNPVKPNTSNIDEYYWHRDGPNAVITMQYGSLGSGTAGSGDYLFTLPSGLRFSQDLVRYTDTAPSNANVEVMGSIHLYSYTSRQENGIGGIVVYDDTRFRIWVGSASSTVTPFTSTGSGAFVRSISWDFGDINTSYKGTFTVPIEGFK